ncbi:MAG: hypothetical protein Q8N96_15890 [Methylovulum sp.]|nr:hypothetical protein [Methylovulum sp.]
MQNYRFNPLPMCVHILADTIGPLLVVVVVTAASVQDRDGAKPLLQRLTGSCKEIRRI